MPQVYIDSSNRYVCIYIHTRTHILTHNYIVLWNVFSSTVVYIDSSNHNVCIYIHTHTHTHTHTHIHTHTYIHTMDIPAALIVLRASIENTLVRGGVENTFYRALNTLPVAQV